MRVFKFGGASVRDAAGIKNVASIIQKYGDKNTLVVVSAVGKTTNALEEVVAAYFDASKGGKKTLEPVKNNHLEICAGLFNTD
ncbi:MAG TPA: aspartate kinase, partial [Chitinophagales bacterium]|nr:aspartate kinase [Chitinophagales bacterium]